jgi:NitT/TauT family transport system permease protein
MGGPSETGLGVDVGGRVAGGETLAIRLLSLASLVAVWWLVAAFFPALVFPGPVRVAGRMWEVVLEERFLFHLAYTLWRVVAAFVVSLLLATTVGILMGLDRRTERFFETFVLVGLTLPALAVSIIVLLVVGFTELGGILAIVVVVTPPMTENVWEGTKNVDPALSKMARVFRADRRMWLGDVLLPQLVPYLLAATRFGLGIGWKIAVIVEWIGLGNGIGGKLRDAFDVFSLAGVMAWTLSFVLVMFVLEFAVIKRVERRLTRWQGGEVGRSSARQT